MPIPLDIPEGMIRNAIAVAVAESFTEEKRDALLRDIIRAHLQYKESTYDKDTILGKKVGEIIRRVALEEVDRIVEQLRPDIEHAVSTLLGPAFRESVLTTLKKSLQNVVVRNITVDVALDRE